MLIKNMYKKTILMILVLTFISLSLFSQTINTNTSETNTLKKITTEQKRLKFIKQALNDFSKKELKEVCKVLELSTKGSKEELKDGSRLI